VITNLRTESASPEATVRLRMGMGDSYGAPGATVP
jgi:hypothetical protein